jgi:perosamine synthetase
MDPLLDIANDHSLFIIEDCAEALGARYKGKLVGTMGDAGCFSFFSNKIITTGEGGMVLTRNQKLAERMALYRDHGMTTARRYWHPVAGFNYRMTNMQAAVGLAQLEQIETFCHLREEITQRYHANLNGKQGISLQPKAVWASPVMWLFTVLLPGYQEHERTLVIERLARCGVEARPFFPPLHLQPPYATKSGNFKTANRLGREGLSLPSAISLSPEDIDRICSILIETIVRYPAASLQEAV